MNSTLFQIRAALLLVFIAGFVLFNLNYPLQKDSQYRFEEWLRSAAKSLQNDKNRDKFAHYSVEISSRSPDLDLSTVLIGTESRYQREALLRMLALAAAARVFESPSENGQALLRITAAGPAESFSADVTRGQFKKSIQLQNLVKLAQLHAAGQALVEPPEETDQVRPKRRKRNDQQR